MARLIKEPKGNVSGEIVEHMEVDNETITRMLYDARFLNTFPALQQAKVQMEVVAPGCCGGIAKAPKANFDDVRRGLAELSDAEKLRLKDLLGARRLSLPYTKPGGGRVVKQF